MVQTLAPYRRTGLARLTKLIEERQLEEEQVKLAAAQKKLQRMGESDTETEETTTKGAAEILEDSLKSGSPIDHGLRSNISAWRKRNNESRDPNGPTWQRLSPPAPSGKYAPALRCFKDRGKLSTILRRTCYEWDHPHIQSISSENLRTAKHVCQAYLNSELANSAYLSRAVVWNMRCSLEKKIKDVVRDFEAPSWNFWEVHTTRPTHDHQDEPYPDTDDEAHRPGGDDRFELSATAVRIRLRQTKALNKMFGIMNQPNIGLIWRGDEAAMPEELLESWDAFLDVGTL